jgi:hypothetical protein
MAAVVVAAIAEIHGGIHRSGLMAEGGHVGMAAIHVLHRTVGGLFVDAGVVGHAAVAETVGHGINGVPTNKL